MTALIENFALTGSQLIGLLAFALVAGIISLLGAAAGGRRRFAEADMVSGWAVISLVFTIVGAANLLNFTVVTYLLLGAALLSAVILQWRGSALLAPAMAKMLVLGIPLIVLVAAMALSQWDEFTNWLPNVRYLLDNDTFPRSGLPKSASVYGAYPYGLPLVMYMTSRLAGVLVENVGAMFNLILLLSFGVFTARLIRAGAGGVAPLDHDSIGAGKGRLDWRWCAFGGLAVTVLNPTFVTKLVFSAYSDSGTAVTLGFAAGLSWLMLEALSRGENSRALAWQAGLALTAMINIRQSNLVLFVALLVVIAIIALRDPHIGKVATLKLLPQLVILPIVVYWVWRLHVGLHPAGAEFSLRPMETWFTHLVPNILARMALIASKKGGYFGLMVVALVLGVRGLIRMRGSFDRLAVLTAGMFGAYNSFLFLAYFASYGEYDALRAASYWRYNTHLGLIALIFAAYGGGLLWHHFVPGRLKNWSAGRPVAVFAVALIVLLPISMSSKIRFDIDWRKIHVRKVGGDLAAMLPATARLYAINTNDNGQYLVIVRYAMYGAAPIIGYINAYTKNLTAEKVRSRMDKNGVSHVWLYQSTAMLDRAFGIDLDKTASHLLVRDGGLWKTARSWSYPVSRRATGKN